MSEKIIEIKNVIFVVKNYELVAEYLLKKYDIDKYIIHVYRDKNKENKYYIDLTNDASLLGIMKYLGYSKVVEEGFKTLFKYEISIFDVEYGNIERIKKIYNIEDISYSSSLNEKIRNVLFNVDNQMLKFAYVFFEKYVYVIPKSDKNTRKMHWIVENDSNFKNCIINSNYNIFHPNSYHSVPYISAYIEVDKKNAIESLAENIRILLEHPYISNKLDILLEYNHIKNNSIYLNLKNLKIRKFTEIKNNSLINQNILLLYIVFDILFDIEAGEYFNNCYPESIKNLLKSYENNKKLDSDLFYSLFSEIYSLL